MIFFLVNAVGESYLGVQIGHYASSNAAAPSKRGIGSFIARSAGTIRINNLVIQTGCA